MKTKETTAKATETKAVELIKVNRNGIIIAGKSITNALKDVNKEVRSLSGALRIVKEFQGYSEIFGMIGIDVKDLTPAKVVSSVLPFRVKKIEVPELKTKVDTIHNWKKVALKDANGKAKKDKEGKILYDEPTLVPVAVWTPNLLIALLHESYVENNLKAEAAAMQAAKIKADDEKKAKALAEAEKEKARIIAEYTAMRNSERKTKRLAKVEAGKTGKKSA